MESLKEPAGNERPRDTDSANGLEGTTWTGNSPESGEFTIQFLKDGKLSYSIKTGSVGGTWKQAGSFVQIVIGNSYSVLEGNVEGKVMKLEGSNQEGLHWKNTLFLKAP